MGRPVLLVAVQVVAVQVGPAAEAAEAAGRAAGTLPVLVQAVRAELGTGHVEQAVQAVKEEGLLQLAAAGYPEGYTV